MATTNLKNDFNLRDHNAGTRGLKLGGTLVTASAAEINTLHSSAVSNADLVKLHAVTSTAAELNILTGVLATAAELNRAADDSTRVVDVTADTLDVTLAAHDKKFITLNRAEGIAITLPAAAGTGALYRFFISTTISGGSTTITVANSSDTMMGHAVIQTDTADAPLMFVAGATDNTITMDGSTTGGLKGACIVIRDVAENLFHVEMHSAATGNEASPFSATV